ncbi:hypothetical protein R4Y45_01315 [Holzapfeliella sp. He02]|uniref:Uncharacterized protein n=1 Tax=Holzapfeliella saturejae TaxID=3082953 RepID=A0ABU8SGR8_9LACO
MKKTFNLFTPMNGQLSVVNSVSRIFPGKQVHLKAEVDMETGETILFVDKDDLKKLQ